MQNKIENNRELRNFVDVHDLRNKHSVIYFNAIVSITTANSKITDEKFPVMISFNDFDSYGKITLMNSEIDPSYFPTIFDAKWQKIKHTNNEHLLIEDLHKQNPNIGKYIVKITPLDKIEE